MEVHHKRKGKCGACINDSGPNIAVLGQDHVRLKQSERLNKSCRCPSLGAVPKQTPSKCERSARRQGKHMSAIDSWLPSYNRQNDPREPFDVRTNEGLRRTWERWANEGGPQGVLVDVHDVLGPDQDVLLTAEIESAGSSLLVVHEC